MANKRSFNVIRGNRGYKKPPEKSDKPAVVAPNRLECELLSAGSVFPLQIRHLERLAGSEFLQPIRNGKGVVHLVVLEYVEAAVQ